MKKKRLRFEKENEGLSFGPFFCQLPRLKFCRIQDESADLLRTNRQIKIRRGAFLHLLVYKFGLI